MGKKNRKKKKKRNRKGQKGKRTSQRLKRSSPREKTQRPKLPLRDKRNPPRHRPKNRSRKSGVGSDESQTRAKTDCRGVPAVLAGATVVLPAIPRPRRHWNINPLVRRGPRDQRCGNFI